MERIKEFTKSFACAWRGLRYVSNHEKNFQNELIAAFLVTAAMLYFKVSRAEVIVLSLVIMGVLILELFNTSIERMMDILKPRVHPYVRLVKDLTAAAVLVSAIFAIVIGLIIFLPYIFSQ